jgi:formate/nitrite transporter
LTAYFISTAVAKSHSAIWKRFISGLLAGCFVVFGCVFALVASGGLDPAFRAAYPAVPKLIIGATFPVCLLMIMLVGGDLFTGNCMYAAMGLFSGRIGLGNVANMLCVSFASNLMGILFFGYFLGYQTELFAAEPYNSWMVSIAVNKVKLSWGVVVLRGVGANAMVCVAVFMGCAARDALGRFVLAYAPITLFAVVGFEHVIANMAFIPISMYYGAPFSVRDYIVRSLIPATIGNIIGGSFLVGAFCAYLYSKPRQSTFGEWLHYVCVPDVEVKEWFKELYLQLLNDRPIKENAAVKTLEAPVKTIK